MEGTCYKHPVWLPDDFRAEQKFKHVVKGIAQMPPKYRTCDTSLGSLFWCLTTISVKKPPVVQLWAIATCPVTVCTGDERCPLLFPFSGSCRGPWGWHSSSFLQTTQTQATGLLLTEHFFSSTFTTFVAIPQHMQVPSHSFQMLGPWTAGRYPRWGCTSSDYSRIAAPLAWWCCVWCTPAWSLLSWHNADSHWACWQPACPDPLSWAAHQPLLS